MSKKEVKTNAMRMLDRAKVSYSYEEYECDDFTDGIQTADKLGYDHKLVYKTLVTTGKTGNHYVFVIPIEAEIDFKKAAKVVGEKSLEMLHLKDLTKVTGYVRGGCTAIGMKKQFPTVIQEDAKELEYMHVSGGKLGMQIRLAPQDLQKVAKAEFNPPITACSDAVGENQRVPEKHVYLCSSSKNQSLFPHILTHYCIEVRAKMM